jgi:hypothetical protein
LQGHGSTWHGKFNEVVFRLKPFLSFPFRLDIFRYWLGSGRGGGGRDMEHRMYSERRFMGQVPKVREGGSRRKKEERRRSKKKETSKRKKKRVYREGSGDGSQIGTWRIQITNSQLYSTNPSTHR